MDCPNFVSVDWHFYLYLNVNQKAQVRSILTRFLDDEENARLSALLKEKDK